VGLTRLGCLVAKDFEAALEEALDQLKFFGRITGGVLEGGGSKSLVETGDALEGFEAGADKDLAAVAGIAKAFDEAGFFEAVENAGDGTGGKAGVAGEVACGEGSLRITGHQFKASGISNIDAQFGGDGLVEKDRDTAEFAAEFHAHPLDQCVAFTRRAGLGHLYGAVDLAHFILTANYLTD
jgi:hypothetical protein